MPSFRISLRRTFVADHFHDLPGFVEPRHGHNWELEATIEAANHGAEAPLAAALDAWIEQIDYTLLNEQPRLIGRNPTTELLAQWALEHLDSVGLRVCGVKVREKANYWAACLPECR